MEELAQPVVDRPQIVAKGDLGAERLNGRGPRFAGPAQKAVHDSKVFRDRRHRNIGRLLFLPTGHAQFAIGLPQAQILQFRDARRAFSQLHVLLRGSDASSEMLF